MIKLLKDVYVWIATNELPLNFKNECLHRLWIYCNNLPKNLRIYINNIRK